MGINDQSGDLLSTVVTESKDTGDAVPNDSANSGDTGNLSYDDQKESDSSVAENQTPQSKPFLDQANPDIREGLSKFNSWNDVGRAYMEAQGKLSQSITLPGKDTTDEERAQLYERLGRPKSPQGYKVDQPKTIDDAEWERVRASAFEGGLSENQFRQQLLSSLKARQAADAEMTAAVKADTETKLEALKKEWGPDYEPRMLASQRAIRQFLTADLDKKLRTSGLSKDPDMVRMFALIGEELGEKSLTEGKITVDTPVTQLTYNN